MADMRPCNSLVSNLEKVDGNRYEKNIKNFKVIYFYSNKIKI